MEKKYAVLINDKLAEEFDNYKEAATFALCKTCGYGDKISLCMPDGKRVTVRKGYTIPDANDREVVGKLAKDEFHYGVRHFQLDRIYSDLAMDAEGYPLIALGSLSTADYLNLTLAVSLALREYEEGHPFLIERIDFGIHAPENWQEICDKVNAETAQLGINHDLSKVMKYFRTKYAQYIDNSRTIAI